MWPKVKEAGTMKKLWKILAWVSMTCGLVSYSIGWFALAFNSKAWVPAELWFYDAIAAGVFGIFFLLYAFPNRIKEAVEDGQRPCLWYGN